MNTVMVSRNAKYQGMRIIDGDPSRDMKEITTSLNSWRTNDLLRL